jgi:hypothetical protein
MKHVFPSGLIIDDKFVASQYGNELKKCRSQFDLDALRQRWMYLCPELQGINPHLETVEFTVDNFNKQCELIELAKQNDQEALAVLNTVVPPSLLRYDMMSHELDIPLGTLLLQLLESGDIESQENFWRLK